MYALIDFKGHQFRVEKNRWIEVPYLADKNKGDVIEISEVLLVGNTEDTLVGKPYVSNAKVVAEVLEHYKGKKIIAMRYLPRKRRRVKKGHRQRYTKLLIKDIVLGG